MDISNLVQTELRQALPNIGDEHIRRLAALVVQHLPSQGELAQVPGEVVEGSIRPAFAAAQPRLQMMIASDHSSIEQAAQYAIQVLITQVVEDISSTVPERYRGSDHCPYPGLLAFSEANTSYFRGRDHDVQSFLSRLPRRLVALTGPSGVGKSSFVQAGIIPRLKQSGSALVLSFRISTTPELLSSFAEYLSDQIEQTTETVLQPLRTGGTALASILNFLYEMHRGEIYLILDQFEELFIGDEPQRVRDRQNLLDNLLGVEQAPPEAKVTVIIATRENYFEHRDYTGRARLIEVIRDENTRLGPLQSHQLRQAIEAPLAMFNQQHGQSIRFQTGLTDLIVGEFHRATTALPLVQYLLRVLWIEKHHLTHFHYNTLGGLERVLDRHATAIYQDFPDHVKPMLQALLLRLVRPGLEGEYTRRRIRRTALLPAKQDVESQRLLDQILHHLSNPSSRLISEQRIGPNVYLELTHEVILRQWTFLQVLVTAHKERIEERERLLSTAEQWEQSRTPQAPGGDPSYLYRGASLERVRRYVQDDRFQDVEPTIIACYESSLQHRRWERIRATTLGVLVLLFFAFTAVWVVKTRQEAATASAARSQAEAAARVEATRAAMSDIDARLQAQIASEESLLRTSNGLLSVRPDVATLIAAKVLASQIDRRSATPSEAIQAIYEALARPHRQTILNRDSGTFPITFAAWHELGRTLVTIDQAGTVTTMDVSPDAASEQTVVLNISLEEEFPPVISNNGHFLAVADQQGSILVWDIDQKRILHQLPGHIGSVPSLKWSSDDTFIASAGNDGKAVIWSVESGTPVLTITHDEKALWPFKDITWSPDDSLVATAGADKKVIIWEVATGRRLTTLGTFAEIVSKISWSPDGETMLTVGTEGEATLWNPKTGAMLVTSAVQYRDIDILTWSPNGAYLLLAGRWLPERSPDDNYLQLWKLGTNVVPIELYGHRDRITSISWNDTHPSFVTASLDGTVKLWDAFHDEALDSLNTIDPFVWISWQPGSSGILGVGLTGEVAYWDLTNLFVQAPANRVESATCSPHGNYIAGLSTTAGVRNVSVWESQWGKQQHVIALDDSAGSGRTLVDWTADENFVALAGLGIGFDVDWTVINARDGTTVLEGNSSGNIEDIQWRPNSHQVAFTTFTSELELWDVESHEKICGFNGNLPGENINNSLLSLAWSADGSQLAVGSRWTGVHILDGDTCQRLTSLGERALDIAIIGWGNNADHLLTVENNSRVIKLWDISSKSSIDLGNYGTEDIKIVELSPDNNFVAILTNDSRLEIWSIETGLVLTSTDLSSLEATDLTWSLDSTQVAYFFADGSAGVLDLVSDMHSPVGPVSGREITNATWCGRNGTRVMGFDADSGVEHVDEPFILNGLFTFQVEGSDGLIELACASVDPNLRLAASEEYLVDLIVKNPCRTTVIVDP